MSSSTPPPLTRSRTSNQNGTTTEPVSPGITVRKAPFPIALVLLLTAVTLTILSVYVPDLIHVTELTPGPTHFETKYGLYRRCTRKTPATEKLIAFATNEGPSHSISRYDQLLASSLVYNDEKVYILERADLSDRSPPKSLDRLARLVDTTRRIAQRSHDSQKQLINDGITTTGLEDTPIDGEGDNWNCTPFPQSSECERLGQKFCILWSTAGYAAQLALAPCVVALIALLVITLGLGSRKVRAQRRRGGWKIVSILMAVHAILQTVSVAIILHIYRTDPRFKGAKSHLDKACDFAVASAIISIATVTSLTLTGVAAEAGQTWAAGKSAKRRRSHRKFHRRTRSGRVVAMPAGEGDTDGVVDEETSLLPEQLKGFENEEDGNGTARATGSGSR
ncbi:hypothetical protein QFC21_003115 [Naganishia friedmannii]|uniref:Uncharacterized protein n=1 Tax=Naganishia friedmannii TaxID=89922 RepID=A0ACC2VSL6_9TREE|nr:hypothetical protein QFC21_003115 [Naganishia friedmannii]